MKTKMTPETARNIREFTSPPSIMESDAAIETLASLNYVYYVASVNKQGEQELSPGYSTLETARIAATIPRQQGHDEIHIIRRLEGPLESAEDTYLCL